MKPFDIKRFGLLAKWSLRMNVKGMLALTAGLMFGMLGLLAGNVQNISVDGIRAAELQMIMFRSISLGILLCMFCISGSWIADNMKTKQERVMYKMLPASDFEKYLMRYVIVTVGFGVCWLVAFCAADLIRIIITLCTGQSAVEFSLPSLLGHLCESFANKDARELALGFSAMLWVHSFYLLGGGGTPRRRQFILTSVVLLVIGIVLTWVAENVKDWGLMQSIDNLDMFVTVSCTVFTLFAVLNYWLSFRLFKRMQVINNKWINV